MNKEEIMKILPHRDNMLLVEQAQVVDGVAMESMLCEGMSGFCRDISRGTRWCRE